MAAQLIQQVWTAIQNLRPGEVQAEAEKSVLVGLHAQSSEAFAEMEAYFCPGDLSRYRRQEALAYLHRAGDPGSPPRFDIEIYEQGMTRPHGTFVFWGRRPRRTVEQIVEAREELMLPLARLFPPFREVVSERIIHSVSRENALFAMVSALPDIVPSIVQLPWTIGQFASDTAFLTANQIRMSFLLAAANDRDPSYRVQRTEIGSLVVGAFGWRAIARELVGKIPLGGGLIPKAAIAYAGTMAAGKAMERLYRLGYGYSREERREIYSNAYESGKRVATELFDALKPGRQRAHATQA